LKISSKKICAILAVVFIAGLISVTVYSRGVAQSRKPFVEIALSESGSLNWSFETRAGLDPAPAEAIERGFEWVFNITIPFEAYSQYASSLYLVTARANFDFSAFFQPITTIHRNLIDNGDIEYVFGFMPDRTIWENEQATVVIENAGPLVYENLIPVSAVHYDRFTGEHYVMSVIRQDGAWGREYVANRQVVEFFFPKRIGDSYNLMFPLTNPVITNSQSPITHGMLVRIFE